jgi:hypothetical protein
MGAEVDFSTTANQKLYREYAHLGAPHRTIMHSEAMLVPPRGLLDSQTRRSGKYDFVWVPLHV